MNTWNNTGYIYLRVQGKNGLFDAAAPLHAHDEADREPLRGRLRADIGACCACDAGRDGNDEHRHPDRPQPDWRSDAL